jgi:hypothetical protein
MSRIRTPENIEIAALKKKAATVFDPMAHGSGTPWEDRGTHGTLGAFFKTCVQGITGPAKLMGSIRRPETTGDARGLLIGFTIIWGISAAMHAAIYLWWTSRPANAVVDGENCAIYAGLIAIGAGVGLFFLFNIYNRIYGRLVAQEKGAPLMPDVLLYNVNVYALGPSLLALIPIAGPPIALTWIMVDLVVAGASRLRLRISAAIIDAVISAFALLMISLAAYFVVYQVMHRLLDIQGVDFPKPKLIIPR